MTHSAWYISAILAIANAAGTSSYSRHDPERDLFETLEMSTVNVGGLGRGK